MKKTNTILNALGAGFVAAALGCSTPREPASIATATVQPSEAAPQAQPATSLPQTPATPAKPKSDSALLQGAWKGQEVGTGADAYLTIEGKNIEFHGADPNEWYKGTFTLKEDTNPRQCVFSITSCASPDYVGKASLAIYKLEEGSLTITGNEPGNPEMPAAFEAEGARRFVFKGK